MFTCVGWQVTLCDPIQQMMLRSSEMGFLLRAIAFNHLTFNSRQDNAAIMAESVNVELVEDFCYMCSNIWRLGNCDKECMMRISKAASVFGRLVNICKSKNISLSVRVKLYESLVISTLMYGTELRPLPVTQMTKLETAHHKFQQRLLMITLRKTKSGMKTSKRRPGCRN